MFSEISRVLRPNGRAPDRIVESVARRRGFCDRIGSQGFISVSLGQPEELNTPRFFRNASYGWKVQYALSYDDYYVGCLSWAASAGLHHDEVVQEARQDGGTLSRSRLRARTLAPGSRPAPRVRGFAAENASPTAALKDEMSKFKGTPPAENPKQWFEKWLETLPEEKETGPGGMDLGMLQDMMGKGGGKGAQGGGKGGAGSAPPETAKAEEVEKEEDGYVWSQQGEEVQIAFTLPKAASKKDVKVQFKQSSILVQVHGDTLLQGSLQGKVEAEGCTWCLVNSGSELNVMLTKQNEKDQWANLLK
ncbi:unnamed protein product [Durusdinium trenchii]|uniref:CS domain-containing protein n=1 Tax=Durusdinium trenchii TaxID=1381693 RepID=A0ABP0LGC3_9DINO